MKLVRKPNKRDWINIVLIILLLGVFIWIGLEYKKTYGLIKSDDLVSTAENLREFILSFGNAGIFIMLFLHALHVVVSFIPAALVQFAGGMFYGMVTGMVIGIIGVSIGTTISFYLSRILGQRVVTLFVKEETMDKLEVVLSKDASVLTLLFLFMIPFPKDFIAYFIGLTKMKFYKFFLISAIGRLPGMFVATYLGTHIFDRNYALIIGVSVFSLLVTLLVYLFRDKLLNRITKK